MARTRWLTAREQHAWRQFLRMHAQLARHLNRQLQRDSDLSASDYDVLVHLAEAPDERRRAFELAAALQWEKSRLSHHLTRMEHRGLVVREECTTDARGAHVALTGAGRRALGDAAPAHVAEVRRVFLDALSPAQVDALGEIADAVLARLDADDG
jgi:DNA-binding MarR family transcriptional regulator